MVDSSGTVQATYVYCPTGNAIGDLGALSTVEQDNPYRLGGGYYDAGTKAYLVNGQYVDANSLVGFQGANLLKGGGFFSEDEKEGPVGDNPDAPISPSTGLPYGESDPGGPSNGEDPANPYDPSHLVIASGKLDYLMGRVDSEDSRGKGGFFVGVLGYTDPAQLDADLRAHYTNVSGMNSVSLEPSDYGPRIVVVGPMTGPSSVTRNVLAVWQIDPDGSIKFITARPAR